MARMTVKDVQTTAPVDTTMKPPSIKRDIVQSPDLVMQRKVKGAGRAIGGRR
jgi:hypothetical protein